MLLCCEVLVNIQHGLVLPNLASCAREGEAAGRRRRGRKRAADRRKGGRGKGREGEREGAGAEGGDGTEGDVCSVFVECTGFETCGRVGIFFFFSQTEEYQMTLARKSSCGA